MWRALCIMQYSRKSITTQMPSHWVLAAMLFQWPRFCHDETKGDYCSKAISIANSDTGHHTFSGFPPFVLCPSLGWVWWCSEPPARLCSPGMWHCQRSLHPWVPARAPRDVWSPFQLLPQAQGHHTSTHGSSGVFTPALPSCWASLTKMCTWKKSSPLLITIGFYRNKKEPLFFSKFFP